MDTQSQSLVLFIFSHVTSHPLESISARSSLLKPRVCFLILLRGPLHGPSHSSSLLSRRFLIPLFHQSDFLCSRRALACQKRAFDCFPRVFESRRKRERKKKINSISFRRSSSWVDSFFDSIRADLWQHGNLLDYFFMSEDMMKIIFY